MKWLYLRARNVGFFCYIYGIPKCAWQASCELVGHGANIYLAGRLLYNSSIKHTSCMKVSFWVSSRREDIIKLVLKYI